MIRLPRSSIPTQPTPGIVRVTHEECTRAQRRWDWVSRPPWPMAGNSARFEGSAQRAGEQYSQTKQLSGFAVAPQWATTSMTRSTRALQQGPSIKRPAARSRSVSWQQRSAGSPTPGEAVAMRERTSGWQGRPSTMENVRSTPWEHQLPARSISAVEPGDARQPGGCPRLQARQAANSQKSCRTCARQSAQRSPKSAGAGSGCRHRDRGSGRDGSPQPVRLLRVESRVRHPHEQARTEAIASEKVETFGDPSLVGDCCCRVRRVLPRGDGHVMCGQTMAPGQAVRHFELSCGRAIRLPPAPASAGD
jgi:hypothetical protein